MTPSGQDRGVADVAAGRVPLRFRHYKGGIYEFVGEATLESDLTPMIVYRSPDGGLWVRPRAVFFELVTGLDGQPVSRFAPIPSE